MDYPTFHAPWLGNGMVIGANAIFHVIISHGIAIGLLTTVILADWLSLAYPDRLSASWERHNQRVLLLAVIVITTLGAVTGAGIWFTTGALAPRGIASMLRIFFWAWFVEWLVFVGEAIVLVLFYLFWQRLASRRRIRLALGVGYIVLAVASAFIITGILGFMLTSGAWPERPSFWTAFFNPSYLPQLSSRLALASIVGALFALAFGLFSREPAEFRRAAAGLFGTLLGGALAVFLVSCWWYYMSVPTAYLDRTFFSVLTSRLSQTPEWFAAINAVGFAVMFLAAAAGALGRVRAARWLVVPALLTSFALAAEFERIREFIRGPYLMPRFMYASGILLQEQPLIDRRGVAGTSPWAPQPSEGAYAEGSHAFAQNCSACHTLQGINSIADRMRGRSEDGVRVLVDHSSDMVSFMPPMAASPRERRAAARFLHQWSEGSVPTQWLSRSVPGAVPPLPRRARP